MKSPVRVVSSGLLPWRRIRAWGGVVLLSALGGLRPVAARAAVTTFFDNTQVATLVSTGTTSDTISSEGYQFTYTRDKLFTGGIGLTNPVGRTVRVPWPQGVEAQAVTVGPSMGGGRIVLERVDGAPFALSAFTARLLANTAGAGGQIEIMPILDGEDAFKDPLYFDATGFYGSVFSYNTSPNHLGSTSTMTNFESYIITLYVDFALTALTLGHEAPVVNEPPPLLLGAGGGPEGGMVLMWTSITTHQYAIHVATNLLNGFTVLQSNIAATPIMNVYTDTTASGPHRFWRVTTEP
jgi:hypothetical protein